MGLEERQDGLEKRKRKLKKEMKEYRKILTIISHRLGILSDESFREAMKYVIQDTLKVAKVSRLKIYDEEGIVYGKPLDVEVDIAIKNNTHILIEVKSSVSKGDVSELYNIGKVYEKKFGIKPRLVIVGGFIDEKAKPLAKDLQVEIVPAIKE